MYRIEYRLQNYEGHYEHKELTLIEALSFYHALIARKGDDAISYAHLYDVQGYTIEAFVRV